jgi:septal ring-binding cell division protein DamX
VDKVEMWENKTIKKVIIIVAVVLLLGIIASLFQINSNIVNIKPEIKSNESGNIDASVMNTNTNQNTTNTTKNMISIPLEKPPFID